MFAPLLKTPYNRAAHAPRYPHSPALSETPWRGLERPYTRCPARALTPTPVFSLQSAPVQRVRSGAPMMGTSRALQKRFFCSPFPARVSALIAAHNSPAIIKPEETRAESSGKQSTKCTGKQFRNALLMLNSIAGESFQKWSFGIDGMIQFHNSNSISKTQFLNFKMQFSNCEIEKRNSILSNLRNGELSLIRNLRSGIMKLIRISFRNERNEMSNSIRNERANCGNAKMREVLIFPSVLHVFPAHWINLVKQSGIPCTRIRVFTYSRENPNKAHK